MKFSWLSVAWGVIALLSGPITVMFIWLLAATAAETGFLVLPDSAPRYSGPKGREADITEILATREQTGGSIGLFRQTIAPQSGPPTHIHETEDEFFYVVKGEFKVKLGDHIMSAPAGSVTFVPRNTVFVIPIDLPNNASVKFSHLILLDTKFPRQTFYFAKSVFRCCIHVAFL